MIFQDFAEVLKKLSSFVLKHFSFWFFYTIQAYLRVSKHFYFGKVYPHRDGLKIIKYLVANATLLDIYF